MLGGVSAVVAGGLVAGSSVVGNAVGVGINIAEALDLKQKAEIARKRANDARRDRSKLVDEKYALSSEIQSLQVNIGEIIFHIHSILLFILYLYL